MKKIISIVTVICIWIIGISANSADTQNPNTYNGNN